MCALFLFLISMPGCDIFCVLLALLFLSWLAMEMSESKIFLQCGRNFVEKGMKLQCCIWVVGIWWECSQHFGVITCVTNWPLVWPLLLFIISYSSYTVETDFLISDECFQILSWKTLLILIFWKNIKKSHLKEKQTPKYEFFIGISVFWFFLSHTSPWYLPLLFGCISSKYFWVFGNPRHCKGWAGIVKVWLESLSRA